MKLRDKETFLSTNGVTDSKSILNKLNKPVDSKYLDKIEAGVTLEDLDEMIALGLPILKYKTQITIHGLFPNLGNNYIFGYKNIFQNKNKSIGVKYNAIDEEKRRYIKERLKPLGFRYNRNSSDTIFIKQVRVMDKQDYIDKALEAKEFASKIDESLFHGGVRVYGGSYMGMWYIITEIDMGAIYQKNIEPLLNGMGATMEVLDELNKKKEQEAKEREEYWAKKEQEEADKRNAILDSRSDELDRLNSMTKVVKHIGNGRFIRYRFNYNDELVFECVNIYTPKGKKKPRINKSEFSTLEEAISHEFEPRYSDSIWNGRITGWVIN